MAIMIRIVCPGCGVKIKAKEELVGKTRKCPKCGEKIVVPERENPSAENPVEIIHANQAETRLPRTDLPKRLNRRHRYLICDKSRLLAKWRDDGQGWLVKGASGFLAAKRNTENLPPYGQFTLIELELELSDAGLCLLAITSYRLASRFAMTKLAIGDDDILRAVKAPGSLNRAQKNIVRQSLKNQFMREVWGGSTDVTEYLGNADYHSPSSRAT